MDATSVTTREDLAIFAAALRAEIAATPDRFENTTLDAFLEAVSAWLGDMPGYCRNADEPVPEQPTWRHVAMMLAAAATYE